VVAGTRLQWSTIMLLSEHTRRCRKVSRTSPVLCQLVERANHDARCSSRIEVDEVVARVEVLAHDSQTSSLSGLFFRVCPENSLSNRVRQVLESRTRWQYGPCSKVECLCCRIWLPRQSVEYPRTAVQVF
jgi:hypothetical protein